MKKQKKNDKVEEAETVSFEDAKNKVDKQIKKMVDKSNVPSSKRPF